jgi:tripartite-type tricarboxylate transporter receptor subunit TctC
MNLPRRTFLHLAAGAVALPAVSRGASAQTYPARPITMIVPYPPGGAADTIGRIVVEQMRQPLGQPIIIENVGGAEGSIGTGRAAHARPDGYTICLGIMDTHVLNGAFYALTYDVLTDFAPISALATNPVVLYARRTLPVKDVNDLVAWLKVQGNQASAGVNSLNLRLVAMLFQKQSGTQFAIIPYRAAGTGVQDLVAGRIDLLVDTPLQLSLVRAGTIKALAVTGVTRMGAAPEIPTFAEMGLPALSFLNWRGLFAPKGTPTDIIDKLNSAAVKALADPVVRSRLAELSFEVFPRERQTPEALAALQKADAERWWPIIKELGIKAE